MRSLVLILVAGLFVGCGSDGSNGKDGQNCEVIPTDTGAQIKCGDTTTDINNGTDGKDGTDGTDGEDGTNGTAGTNGTDGKDGTNGTDGEDGTDNRIVKKIFCMGNLSGGAWSGVDVRWEAVVMESGDVFASALVEDLGNFNTSYSSFHAAGTNGANEGSVIFDIDNVDSVIIKYNPLTDGISVQFVGANPETYIDSSEDACVNYFY